ncbi:MAG: two-component system response regulator [Gammaproteobacteria bacterium]|nr:two-component system response regulator [Gammaproteobacteria bacterium]MBI5614891.1 two-component system response regulator [Gammaproteobacteria bacterium]
MDQTAYSTGTPSQATILIVDDAPENLNVLGHLLRASYHVRVANSGRRCLEIAGADPKPDLILLDVMMPEIDGYEVLRRLRDEPRTRDIPVIFVTALDGTEDEQYGLDLGAVDYITKPLRPPIVLARIHAQLELKHARDLLKNQNTFLEAEVVRRMGENQLIQDVSIHALARLAETRDPETGNHLKRTEEYVRALARRLQREPRFSAYLTERMIATLAKSALLHDIGKVGIPDHILLKPGRLTPEEWEIMKTHTLLASDAIERAEQDAERPVEFLILAKEIARHHHERWDGCGYPDGLAGEAIPISARLMALADVFDAVSSRRVYKEASPCEEARDIIAQERGKHFDPEVVDAFLDIYEEFKGIAFRYGETIEPPAPNSYLASSRRPEATPSPGT